MYDSWYSNSLTRTVRPFCDNWASLESLGRNRRNVYLDCWTPLLHGDSMLKSHDWFNSLSSHHQPLLTHCWPLYPIIAHYYPIINPVQTTDNCNSEKTWCCCPSHHFRHFSSGSSRHMCGSSRCMLRLNETTEGPRGWKHGGFRQQRLVQPNKTLHSGALRPHTHHFTIIQWQFYGGRSWGSSWLQLKAMVLSL